MIPKRKRRVVVVDDVEYEYSVSDCVSILSKT